MPSDVGALIMASMKRTGPSTTQLHPLAADDPMERTVDTIQRDAALPSEPDRMHDLRHCRAVASVRIVFGLVWAVDAALKWTPHFINGYLEHLDEGSVGRPGWLQPWFQFWHDLQSPAPRAAAYFVAITETLIAVALLLGVARKLTFLSATAFSLMIWAIPEGFGGPYTGRGADVDVSAGLIYALVFVSLLFITADGPDSYSLDAVIERHHPRWRRIAELKSDRADPAPRRLPADAAKTFHAVSNESPGLSGNNSGGMKQ